MHVVSPNAKVPPFQFTSLEYSPQTELRPPHGRSSHFATQALSSTCFALLTKPSVRLRASSMASWETLPDTNSGRDAKFFRGPARPNFSASCNIASSNATDFFSFPPLPLLRFADVWQIWSFGGDSKTLVVLLVDVLVGGEVSTNALLASQKLASVFATTFLVVIEASELFKRFSSAAYDSSSLSLFVASDFGTQAANSCSIATNCGSI
mmetsp:Transcript_71940/g.114026  ORF Transcript_71940/g.114026 Transcript_71940/m.114026 type:complete len:209 (-) Transcript_71940:1113-1739(-)